MNKWKLLTRALRRGGKDPYETAAWMHVSSDDEDSHDWVENGWVNGTGLFGSGDWLENGWAQGTGLFGNGNWMENGWSRGAGIFGNEETWVENGWAQGTGPFGSGDWLDNGWTQGTGPFGRAYRDHGGAGGSTNSGSDSDYGSSAGSSWGNDSWGNSGSGGSGGGGGARRGTPAKKDRIRFPWFSLIFTFLLLGSTGWVPDLPVFVFGAIFIINFIRWIKQ